MGIVSRGSCVCFPHWIGCGGRVECGAMEDDPSTEGVPEDKEGYMKGLYAEARTARRLTQHILWIFIFYLFGRICGFWV